jgi:hypothetical protein
MLPRQVDVGPLDVSVPQCQAMILGVDRSDPITSAEVAQSEVIANRVSCLIRRVVVPIRGGGP